MSPVTSTEGTAQRAARAKWLAQGSGERYATARFAGARAKERDVRNVGLLLDATLGSARAERLLDVPCGGGRLTAALASRSECYVGLDASRSMLQVAAEPLARAAPSGLLLEGDGLRLPFADGAFDVVVACRWLHHLRDEQDLRAALAELVRVSRGIVIASFWDDCSLPGWRRRLRLKRDEGPSGRGATTRPCIERLLGEARADVVAWRSTLRFVSQQSFFAARVRREHA
jgi:SAM-dependent methyltransferase